MSSLYISKDGREMLDLVDKLRAIERIEKTIPLPQIVVAGQQSSGKSSVLHAISGIQFPIDDGLCTQFPTEIILRRDNVVRTKASIRHSSDISDQRRSDLQKFEAAWQHSELSNLKDIIAEAKKVLNLSERKRFSDESLVLEISGPDQEHLTLIDLPGYFISTQAHQESEDIKLVNEIAKRYVSNPRAVVLAIVSGKNDSENQLILENLKKDADLRQRTLGVITAPDAVEPGSRREDECIQLVQHDPRGLGHGWHVLRNSTFKELKAGSVDRDAVERRFFEQTPRWNRLDSKHVGSQALKARLSSILKNKIAESLPAIQQEIDLRLDQIYADLEKLGEPRESPEALLRYLSNCADSFKEEMKKVLQGLPPVPMNGLIHQIPSLRACVQGHYEEFANEMFENAQTWKIDPQGTSRSDHLLQILEDRQGTRDTAIISAQVLTTWLSKQMSKHRGKHPSNLVHLDWATAIFHLKSQRWEDVAKAHVKLVFDEVSNYVTETVYNLVEDAVASRLLHEIITPALRQRKETLDQKLKELYYPYTLPSIYCVSRRYKSSIDTQQFGESAYTFAQCSNMLKSAEAFYEVAVDVFTDNVITLGVESCLLDHLWGIIEETPFYQMPAERLERLGGESSENKEQRQRLMTEKRQFEEARDSILPAFNSRRSLYSKRPTVSRQGRVAVNVTPPESDKLAAQPVEITPATPPATPSNSSKDATMTPAAKATPSGPTFREMVNSTNLQPSPSSSFGVQSSSGNTKAPNIFFPIDVTDKTRNGRSLTSRSGSPNQTGNANPPAINFAGQKFSFAPSRKEDDL